MGLEPLKHLLEGQLLCISDGWVVVVAYHSEA